VAAASLLNLVLTLGIIRRLREHAELLSTVAGDPKHSVRTGEKVGDFTTLTVDGAAVTSDLVTEQTLVAFFSPGCKPCQEKLPKFIEFARSMPGGRRQVLAAVVGTTDTAPWVAELDPVSRVVVEDNGGPLTKAFEVKGFPTTLMVDRDGVGRLVVTADSIDLGQPAAVPA
jgi:thiol-disulfide isomerase/thioredoxin